MFIKEAVAFVVGAFFNRRKHATDVQVERRARRMSPKRSEDLLRGSIDNLNQTVAREHAKRLTPCQSEKRLRGAIENLDQAITQHRGNGEKSQ